MIIKYSEPGCEAFYKEVINIANQYKRILKNPKRKVRDILKEMKRNIIGAAVIFVLCIAEMLIWGFDTALAFCAFVMVMLILVCGRWLKNANNYVESMMKHHEAVFTINEDGVEIDNPNTHDIRMKWEKIAMIKSYKESTCFIPKDVPGVVIAIQNKDRETVLEYVKGIGKEEYIK